MHVATNSKRKFFNPAPKTATESDAHTIARHLQLGLWVLLALALISTVICLFFFEQQAYLAAIPIPILFLLLLGAHQLEKYSRAEVLRDSGSQPTEEEVYMDEAAVGISLVLKLAGVFALSAIIIAASLFQWEAVGLVATVLFLMAILIGLPYWPLMVAETRAAEHDKVVAGDKGARP